MKAARLHAYHEALKLEEIDEPTATGPLDVVVRIGAAGRAAPICTSRRGSGRRSRESSSPYMPGDETPAGYTRSGRR